MNEIGGKDNQEDCLYPYKGVLTNSGLPTTIRCFVLCDGMGGHENGEVAAGIVSSTLQPAMLESAGSPDIMTVDRFETALKKTYTELDKMDVAHGKRPGTTMTCVYFAENGVFVAHIGDSRIYQVRPGKGIIFRTSDHSLVNELVKAGEITEEEAAHHPRRNVILRAMQPGLEVPYNADTAVLTDVQAGDYFFMCSDGVLENLTDQMLVDILSKNISDIDKNNEIFNLCLGRTRDNFSSILIPVVSVSGKALPTPAPAQKVHDIDIDNNDQTVSANTVSSNTVRTQHVTVKPDVVKASPSFFDRNKQWIIAAVAVIIAVVVTVFICMTIMGDKKEEPAEKAPLVNTEDTAPEVKDVSNVEETITQIVTDAEEDADHSEQTLADQAETNEKITDAVGAAEALAKEKPQPRQRLLRTP